MRTLFSLICAFLIGTASPLCGEIISIESLSELIPYANHKTLFAFDLDDVLIAPEQTLGSHEWFLYRLQQNLALDLPEKEAMKKTQEELKAVWLLSKFVAAEEGIPELFSTLKSRRSILMGLTGKSHYLAPTVFDKLEKFGIVFSRYFNRNNDIYLYKNGNASFFSNGVFFTQTNYKLNSLMELNYKLILNRFQCVYISKSLEELTIAEQATALIGLEFIGVLYDPFHCNEKEFKSEVADVQWNLSTFPHILSDAEAEEYLEYMSPK